MKRFKYDVFTQAGVYITTWSDVASEPTFSASVNGGLSEMVITLARNADSFGEGTEVDFKNQINVYVFDNESVDGVKLFTGFISGYTPALSQDKEVIQINVLGYIQELSMCELLDNGAGIQDTPTTGNTKLIYTSKDPANILKDIIDKYRALTGVSQKVNYAVGSIDLTATTVTYTFNSCTILDAIKKCFELCPPNWYWYIDENNVIHLHQFGTTPDYTLYVKKDIKKITPNKRIENVKNVVYVTGGGGTPMFKVYKNDTSIANYGRNVSFIVDQRATTANAAQALANSEFNTAPEVRTQIEVVDSNNDEGKGFDIELLKPGKVINILNFLSKKTYSLWGVFIWGVDVWGFDISNVTATNVSIIKVSYKPDEISLEVASKIPQMSQRIEDVASDWQNNIQANNPAQPS